MRSTKQRRHEHHEHAIREAYETVEVAIAAKLRVGLFRISMLVDKRLLHLMLGGGGGGGSGGGLSAQAAALSPITIQRPMALIYRQADSIVQFSCYRGW